MKSQRFLCSFVAMATNPALAAAESCDEAALRTELPNISSVGGLAAVLAAVFTRAGYPEQRVLDCVEAVASACVIPGPSTPTAATPTAATRTAATPTAATPTAATPSSSPGSRLTTAFNDASVLLAAFGQDSHGICKVRPHGRAPLMSPPWRGAASP
jgi:hypothetical protein